MAAVDTVKGRYSTYELLADVGHGGSARVYRAQDVATKKEVAVKQLFGNRPQDREDWLREVDALHTLNKNHCPHVVQYLDHMQQHGKLFLVEEYAARGSLLRRLKQEGPLSEAVVCRYIYQILGTLHAMAQWNLVHGDLKASNVLLFNNGKVKLTDFALRSRGEGEDAAEEKDGERGRDRAAGGGGGRASSSGDGGVSNDSRLTGSPLQRTRTAVGGGCGGGLAITSPSAAGHERNPTVHEASNSLHEFRGSIYWAAPEVLAGESRITAASDIWSLGCTTLELLTGTPPYFDRSIPNATHRILKGYYEAMEAGRKRSANQTPSAPVDAAKEAPEAAPVAEKNEEATVDALMPPLPPELHLSDEGLAFLKACLRLRPAERPSASELLQHEWFLNCVVSQLLVAARDGRTPTGGSGSANGGPPLPEDGATRFAVIERWVEVNLLSKQDARCEAWLRSEALPLLVPVLTPRIMTPKYIGNVMGSFAKFADGGSALAPLFLNRLGATDFWGVDELTSACDTDHLALLFRCCCEGQEALVPYYTPTDPRALRFVLRLEKAKAQECVSALQRLCAAPSAALVDAAVSPRATVATPMEESPPALAEHVGEEVQQRRVAARERLLQDGGAAVLCQCVEAQCKRAFLSNAAPLLEWGTVNALLDVVSTLDDVPGGQRLLWGLAAEHDTNPLASKLVTSVPSPSPSTTGGSASAVTTTNAAAAGGATRHDASSTAVAGGPMEADPPLNSPLSVSSCNLISPTNYTNLTSGPGSPCASARAINVHLHQSFKSAAPPPAASGTPGSHNINTAGSDSPTTEMTSSEWVSSLSWRLAVQEAAHHRCDAAVHLLRRFIPLAKETEAEYLDKAGVSLSATLVLVASREETPMAVRQAAVACLPLLQSVSLRAARYLRDPVRTVPLLALTLKRSLPHVPALTVTLLTTLRGMTAEKQMRMACVGCPWMWEALLCLLHDSCPSENTQREDDTARPAAEANTASGIGSAYHAVLADALALMVQWSDDVSLPTLLSVSAAVAGQVTRNMATMLSPAVPATSQALMSLQAASMGNQNEFNTSGHNVNVAATPPLLSTLLQSLRHKLTILSQNSQVCTEDTRVQVHKVLEYLAPLDASALTAK